MHEANINVFIFHDGKYDVLYGTAEPRVRRLGAAVTEGVTVPCSGSGICVFSSGTSLRHIYRSSPPASHTGLRY